MNKEKKKSALTYFQYFEFSPLKEAKYNILMVYLHGSGERGSDLDDLFHDYSLVSLLGNGLEVDYRIICPQCRAGEEWNIELLETFIDEVRTADENLIVTGFSMGATAVWKLGHRNKINIKAIVPIAGSCELTDIGKLKDIAVFAVYGESDKRLFRSNVKTFIDDIVKAGGNTKLSILANQDHHIGSIAYSFGGVCGWIDTLFL